MEGREQRRECQGYLQDFQSQCEVHDLEFCLYFITFVELKLESYKFILLFIGFRDIVVLKKKTLFVPHYTAFHCLLSSDTKIKWLR